ncbi:hypothetical protein MASRES_GEN12915_18125 [Acinetobacter baumannii]|nr:Uncharacterised protein [Acinetobacter baumannii]SSQ43991.1 Uncharacterised protein [Acinetobacter baumannii]
MTSGSGFLSAPSVIIFLEPIWSPWLKPAKSAAPSSEGWKTKTTVPASLFLFSASIFAAPNSIAVCAS